jgi:hypothetical protein
MSVPNQEYLEKAAITTDAIASAGKLNEEQAEKFIDFIMDETGLAQAGVRTVTFRNEKWEVDKIGVANRVAVAAEEAKDPAVRRGVSHSKVTLQPQDVMVPFELSDLYKRHNIEGDSVEEHVIRMMATTAGNNIEELFLDGNALGPAVLESEVVEGGSSTQYRQDTYLGLTDGLLVQAESGHVYDAENARLDPTRFSAGLREMPNKFRKNRSILKHFLGWDHEQLYREGLATRATAMGDLNLEGMSNITAFGVPFYPLSLMQSAPKYVEHVQLNGTTAVDLAYAPITDAVVTTSTLSKNPEAAYVADTDYTIDLAAGTLVRIADQGITDGETVKVTYNTAGRTLLCNPANIIIGVGLEIGFERDRNIYTRMNEYAIHLAVDIVFEETDAVVLYKNLQLP